MSDLPILLEDINCTAAQRRGAERRHARSERWLSLSGIALGLSFATAAAAPAWWSFALVSISAPLSIAAWFVNDRRYEERQDAEEAWARAYVTFWRATEEVDAAEPPLELAE